MTLNRNVNAIRIILSEMLIDPSLDKTLLLRELQALRDDVTSCIDVVSRKIVDTPGKMG